LPAIVREVRISGALVKVGLADGTNGAIQVELGRDQYERLQLAVGEPIFVRPKRMRVFPSDCSSSPGP
jgi:hypothetical protein